MTSDYTIYFIGCDIGGWHGTNDGLAVCKWNGTELEHECEQKGKLFYPVSECLDEIIRKAKSEEAKIVIGIEAALAWPVKFAKLISSATKASHLPSFDLDGAINNPYLYRKTEKFIKENVLKGKKERPLTAPGDKFGNNSSKGQALAAWFQKNLNGLYRPPFDKWKKPMVKEKRFTLIEIYPKASIKSTAFKKLKWPKTLQSMVNVGASDIADAKRAAMTCVCYAATVGLINNSQNKYPPLYVPSDVGNDEVIGKEGWIFSPKMKKSQQGNRVDA